MKSFKTAGRVGLIAFLFASVAGGALAQTVSTAPASAPPPQDDRDARINALEAQVQALSSDLEQLDGELTDLKRGQAAETASIATVQASVPPKPTGVVAFAGGKPTIASADGKFSLTLHGVLQLDTAAYFQQAPGLAGTALADTDFRRDGPALGTSGIDAAHARDLKDGTVIRRSRLGFDGTAFGDWDYRFVYDFGGSGTEDAGQVYETWVQYSGFKPLHIRVGAFPASIGLEDQASTNSMPFIERSVDSDLARGLAAGDTRMAAALWANGAHWLASGAITGRTIGVLNTGTASATAQSYGDQLGLVGRFAGTPFHGDDWLVHVGIDGSYVIHPPNTVGPPTSGALLATPAASEVIAFSDTPELRVDGTKFINTGNLDAKHAATVGFEFAAQKANFLVQSEYNQFYVQRDDGTVAVPVKNPSFHGWYVEGLWMLTGEHRNYNAATGAFDGPTIAHPFDPRRGGWGAWELGVRYSDMDLNYDAGAPGTWTPSGTSSVIRGGDEQNVSVALSWFPNPVVRFLLDYEYVMIRRLSPATSSPLSYATAWDLPDIPGVQIGQNFSAISVRSQIAF